MSSISFGRPNLEWEQYALVQLPVIYGGETIGDKSYKAILQAGRLVAIVGSDYQLLPNEEVVAIGDETARVLGAVPFNQFKGNWYVKMNEHVIFNREKTRIHALYAFNEKIDVGGGDTFQLGFAIHNGIDGGRAFGAGAFSFRNACANMILMGWKGFSTEFDQRKTLAWVYHKHTQGLDVERPVLEKLLVGIVDKARAMLDTYRQWKEVELNKTIAENLVKALPKKFLPPYIESKDQKLTRLVSNPSVYTTLNDITYRLTHDSKAELERKEDLYERLHQAIIVGLKAR